MKWTGSFEWRGSTGTFGWVQLVRSTDNASAGEQFEPDPFALFADARSPYCWYGTEPTPTPSDRSTWTRCSNPRADLPGATSKLVKRPRCGRPTTTSGSASRR